MNHAPLSMLALARRYLAHRRQLGYTMRSAQLLLDFGRYADRVAPGRPLTSALAMSWASAVPAAQRRTHAGRLAMVRGFARYCASFDSRTQVPEPNLLGSCVERIRPHIFTPDQTRLLLSRARHLSVQHSALHPLTYETLIGLLACTGMRPGEALRLQVRDFDPSCGQLRVRPCKFSPERIIPLHASCVAALQRYLQMRRMRFPSVESFFVNAAGRALSPRRTEKVFASLSRGIVSNGQRPTLRMVDFRHTFASARIARWSRCSGPLAHHLLLLARYLGHSSFNSTWWYVSSGPAALQGACERFRHFHEKNNRP